jgi:protein-L-isoaspartate(D-aspartate) O-methyltransferase
MYESERKDLINKISKQGITDESVLKAMLEVERHLFVPEAIIHNSYKDVALPIGYNQTISQPYTVAFMTQVLNLRKGYKVLEIGTGSGYQAAILEKMGMKVYTIERHPEIFLNTQKLFDKLRIRVACRLGDGTIGWVEYAPFDGILVTAGSPSVPENFKKQLAVGGRLVIPVGDKHSQVLKVLTKKDDETFEMENIPQFAFVPLIGKEGWKEK